MSILQPYTFGLEIIGKRDYQVWYVYRDGAVVSTYFTREDAMQDCYRRNNVAAMSDEDVLSMMDRIVDKLQDDRP
jgi:hypothetical protein